MAKLLFKLNSVPDDEAEEIRALLAEAEINFYETTYCLERFVHQIKTS